MTKVNERFEHGLHNELACEYLTLNDKFRDWVITTSFYSALHFVSSRIFPFKVPAIEGKKNSIESVDQYYNYIRAKVRNISKHEVLLDLVNKHFSDETIICYEWLLTTATVARYSQYQFQQEIANRAVTYLRKIKKSCT